MYLVVTYVVTWMKSGKCLENLVLGPGKLPLQITLVQISKKIYVIDNNALIIK